MLIGHHGCVQHFSTTEGCLENPALLVRSAFNTSMILLISYHTLVPYHTMSHKWTCEIFNYSVDGGNAEAIGKYINDSPKRYSNCYVRPERIYGVLKLCIYALKVIKNGEELRYDYKMADSPWRKLVIKVNNLILHPCFHLREVLVDWRMSEWVWGSGLILIYWTCQSVTHPQKVLIGCFWSFAWS